MSPHPVPTGVCPNHLGVSHFEGVYHGVALAYLHISSDQVFSSCSSQSEISVFDVGGGGGFEVIYFTVTLPPEVKELRIDEEGNFHSG